MTTDRCRRVLGPTVLATACLLWAAPVQADVLSEMNRFWQGAAVNTTGPTAFEGQASGHWTLGNLYLRSPVRAEPIATVNLPLVPGRVRRHRCVRGRLLLHRFRAAGGLRPRDRPERGGLRLRARPRDHLAGHRGDDVEAQGPRPVGQQPERQLLRDRPGARRRGVVEGTTGPRPRSVPRSGRRRGSSRTTPRRATVAAPTAVATRPWRPPPARWPTRCPSTSTTPGRPCRHPRSSRATPSSPSSR